MRSEQYDATKASVIKHLGKSRVRTKRWMRVEEENQKKHREGERRTPSTFAENKCVRRKRGESTCDVNLPVSAKGHR